VSAKKREPSGPRGGAKRGTKKATARPAPSAQRAGQERRGEGARSTRKRARVETEGAAPEGDAPPSTRRHRRAGARLGEAPLVLVVDDFADGRALIVETLDHYGFRTLEAGDGREALAKARASVPDLILMDLSLPGLDGWVVTRHLKEDPATAGIVIVALTAHAHPEALTRALEAGADEIVTKPCLPTDVVARVRDLLGASASSGEE
jgi:CheY-like chemotaxis protein